MILPVVVTDSAIKFFYRIRPLGDIKNMIFARMAFVQESFNFSDIIPPIRPYIISRITHNNNSIFTDI